MADLTLTGLTKSFGTGFAVDRVELAVADGQRQVGDRIDRTAAGLKPLGDAIQDDLSH